ncbi:MAG: class I SAM-dependent methyltransferase [Dehalococcoidia bacterium]|nr:class I SAM-dependent methyltransferase [Dehalococcoidia bacterium]
MTIIGKVDTDAYCRTLDAMARWMRDRGWYRMRIPRFLLTVPVLLAAGIDRGDALEIGPGPGYLGLEWLKRTHGTTLTGLDLSAEMVELARSNAAEYGLADRAKYVLADASDMPFEGKRFSCVFSSASLHEWLDPSAVFNEVARVLKPGGSYYIADLRRSMSTLYKRLVWFLARPREVRPYFMASVCESYRIGEVKAILRDTLLANSRVCKALYGMRITGQRA